MFADHRFDYLSQVRFYGSYVLTPVYWLADLPRRLTDNLDAQVKTRRALLEENARLREELLRQSFQLQKLEHLSAENERLNSLLNASAVVDEMVMRAQLISESSDPFSKRVLINRGQRDGVFMGQPVLDGAGLVGQVVEVGPFTSWVLLITDAQHATPVQINRNGVRAVAAGTQGTLHELELRNIPNTRDVRVGDLLVSSGLGQTFPPGYPVGVITKVIHDPGQPFALVTAVPKAELDKSRNLLLLFEEKQQEEGAAQGAGAPAGAGDGEAAVTASPPAPTDEGEAWTGTAGEAGAATQTRQEAGDGSPGPQP